MKRAALASLVAAAATTFAAPASAQTIYDWTGFFFGSHVGLGTLTDKTKGSLDGFEGAQTDSTKEKDFGAFAGFQTGYNVQFANFVIGPIAQVSFGDFGNNSSLSAFTFDGGEGFDFNEFLSAKTSLHIWTVLGGRAGVALGPVFFYGLGGVAFSDLKVKFRTPDGDSSTKNNSFGYVVGGGVEYTFSPPVTFFLEGQYIDFGKVSASFPGFDGGEGGPFGFGSNASVKTQLVTVKFGVNYKF